MPNQGEEQHIVMLPLNNPIGFATKGNVYSQPVLQNCENWWPATHDAGSLEVVPGFAPLYSTSTAGRLTMIAGGEKASAQKRRYFVSGDTSTWLVTTNGTMTEVKTGLATDSKHTVVSFGDHMLFFPYDAATAPYKYDFTSDTSGAVTDIGLVIPDVSGMSMATNGEGNVKGVVKYFVVYMSGTTQLGCSAASSEINAGDGSTIDITSIPVSAGKFRYIFRTRAGGTQPYFVGSIEDDTTTTFSDAAADFDLGFVPDQHGQPPPTGSKYAVVYNNRVYCAGYNDYEVVFSDINKPQSFNTFSFFQVGGKDGDEISGLAKIRGAILVFKRNHVYKIMGRDPEVDMVGVDSLRSDDPDSKAIGCPDQSAMCSTPEGIFFFYNNNFYMMSNQCTVANLSGHFEDELRDDVNQSKQENIVCWFDPNRRIVYASVPTGSSTYPSRTYLYFLDFQAWVKMTVGFTAARVVEIGADGNPPDSYQAWAHYNAATPLRRVQRLDHPTATDFDGDAIVAQAVFPPRTLSAPGDLSFWQRGRVTFDVANTSTSLQLRWNIYSFASADRTISVPLTKSGFNRWTREFGFGYSANELALNVYWPGGSVRPVVHGVELFGFLESNEAKLG